MSRACDGAALPDEKDASGSQKKDVDLDQISVVSTGVITTTSRTHQRREHRRQLATQRETLADSAAPVLKVMQDAAIQCDLEAPTVTDTAKRKVQKLRKKLNESRLQVVALKWEVASFRRMLGEQSDEDWWGCNSASSSSISSADGSREDDSRLEEETAASIDGEGCEMDREGSQDASVAERQEVQDDERSLDDNIEVGDIAMVTGLTSEKGEGLNGYYGTVVAYNAQTKRFGIRIKGETVALKVENLEMGMKKEEMSDEDETLLLGLRPAAKEVRELPFLERIKLSRTRGCNTARALHRAEVPVWGRCYAEIIAGSGLLLLNSIR